MGSSVAQSTACSLKGAGWLRMLSRSSGDLANLGIIPEHIPLICLFASHSFLKKISRSMLWEEISLGLPKGIAAQPWLIAKTQIEIPSVMLIHDNKGNIQYKIYRKQTAVKSMLQATSHLPRLPISCIPTDHFLGVRETALQKRIFSGRQAC